MQRLLQLTKRRFSILNKYQHESKYPLGFSKPITDEHSWIDASATLAGEVIVNAASRVYPNTVIRADLNSIVIGQSVAIMENCSLSTAHSVLTSGQIGNMTIGDGSIVMPGTTLVSCKIGKYCFIGSNSVVCEGAVIEEGAFLAPNTVVPPNRVIPKKQVWAGNPARFVKGVEKQDEYAFILRSNRMLEEMTVWKGEELDLGETYLQLKEIEQKTTEEEHNTKERSDKSS